MYLTDYVHYIIRDLFRAEDSLLLEFFYDISPSQFFLSVFRNKNSKKLAWPWIGYFFPRNVEDVIHIMWRMLFPLCGGCYSHCVEDVIPRQSDL